MRFSRFLLFLLLLLPLMAPAQDRERLRKSFAALQHAPDDTNKVLHLDNVAWDTSYDNLAVGLVYGQQALALAEKLEFDHGIIRACNTLGTIYADMGDLNKALSYHLKGLALAEKRGDVHSTARSELNISIVYTNMGDLEKSLAYLLKSKANYDKVNEPEGISAVCNDLGGCYLNFKDSIVKAEQCFRRALEIEQQTKRPFGIATSLAGLSKCYFKLGDTLRSDETMLRAIAMMDSLKNDYGTSQLLVHYAAMLSDRGHYTKAESLLMRALGIYRSIGMKEQEIELWHALSGLYEKMGRYSDAIDAWKKHSVLRDSVMNENVLRHQSELEALYENEKKENEIRSLTQARTLQNIYVGGLVIGVVFLVVLLLVLYNRSSLRRKSNQQLALQNAVIEEKNKNITDSITYARRIQEALLPHESVLQKQFADAFVLYRPRDIVSGDFWWSTEKDGRFILAAADCTGHGVPGGFMSVMSAAFLSEVVNEKGVTEPAEILSQLRQKVIEALKQGASQENTTVRVQDGMDIVVCAFSPGGKLEFACANNPLWLVRDGALQEFPADKFPVGIHHDTPRPFTPQELHLRKGDMLYLFSDGYADQFGGPSGKKYKYRQLKELLLSISAMPAQTQEQRLATTFDNWKGALEQVDDVLLIGIRY